MGVRLLEGAPASVLLTLLSKDFGSEREHPCPHWAGKDACAPPSLSEHL